MDKSWISKSSLSAEYEKGLNEFLDFAFAHSQAKGLIRCPCKRCGFKKWQSREVAYDHLICTQFPPGYIVWEMHGELVVNDTSNAPQTNLSRDDTMQDMVCDAFGVSGHYGTPLEATLDGETNTDDVHRRQTGDDTNLVDLLRDCNEELYEGCTKYSKLSFIIKLYHIKVLCRMSDKAMSMILELLHDAFENSKIPNSSYEAKKIINKLGLNYIKIDACPDDCMLYWKEDANEESCKICGKSRWKDDVNASRTAGEGTNKKKKQKKKRPAKVLRYFPLKPRLQRLFMSSKTAKLMRWHHEDDNNDGKMRHPRDSEAWKSFNSSHNEFSSESRNVRLGLASDGFNPFGTMSTSYSIWPVVLMPYNLPPWMCMKHTSFILSMIIPGKRQPGNDIDVYLQPLIEELNELWTDGMETYDASLSENFTLRAALMWTISDFPGLGSLSGWNVYTGSACPSCNEDQEPCRLGFSQKWCFMGHRRFLDGGHKFRLNRVSRFDGKPETRNPPKLLTGSEILKQVENISVVFGKKKKGKSGNKRPRGKGVEGSVKEGVKQWRKKSIFFQLPYWESNLLRHNLDVMHIEKNVCDNVIYTLFNDPTKSKDNLSARKDLREMGIRQAR